MRPVVWLLFLIALCALGFFFVEYTLFNTIMAFAEAKAVQMAITTVNEAVREEISRQRLTYEDLVQVHKDNEGRVVLIQADTVKITQLAADVAVTTEEALARLRDEDFGIPLGQITGSQLLANYGPDIKVGIVPVGSVKVCMLDKFESAGINQTRHRFFYTLMRRCGSLSRCSERRHMWQPIYLLLKTSLWGRCRILMLMYRESWSCSVPSRKRLLL